MIFTETPLSGAYLITPKKTRDERGIKQTFIACPLDHHRWHTETQTTRKLGITLAHDYKHGTLQ